MSSYLDTAKLWFIRSARESRQVQGEATMETLRRYRFVVLVVLAINLTYIISIWQLGISHRYHDN